MPPRLIPLALALAWGLNWPVVKIVLNGGVPPFTLRWAGLGGAALLLALVALWRGTSLKPAATDAAGIVIGGVLTVAAFSVCTAFAQLATTTSRAAVLTYTMPMIAALLARIVLGERLERRHALALALGMAGIALLAWPVWRGLGQAQGSSEYLRAAHSGMSPSGGRAGSWSGLLLPLLAASAWAAGTVAAKRWPLCGDRIVNTAWQLAIGALAGLIGALAFDERWPQPLVAAAWLALAFHVVVATALAYVLWFQLLDRLSASVAAITTLVVPVVGVLGAMALVGERPSGLDALGFALVLSGAGLAAVKPGR